MLYPKAISLPYGGNIFTASPNVAVNIAVTAGLFSLPLAGQVSPSMKIYAPFDRSSTMIAAKRLTALVAVGGAIKAVHWAVMDDSRFFDPDFDPYLEEVMALITDTTLVLDNTLASDTTLVLDNTLVLEDTLALDNAPGLDDTLALDNAQLDDTLELDVGSGVEETLGQGDDSEPNGAEVIIIGTGAGFSDIKLPVARKSQSTEFASPLGYRDWLEVCDVPEQDIGNMTMAEDSPVLGFGEPLVSCTSVEVLDLSTGVIVQDAQDDFPAGVKFGLLFVVLAILEMMPILIPAVKLFWRAITGIVPRARGALRGLHSGRWTTTDPPLGSNRVPVGEFWVRRRTMWNATHLVKMNFEEGFGVGYPGAPLEFRARPGNETLLFVLESLAFGTMWVSIKILGEAACKEALERTFVEHKLPDHTRRYLRHLLFPKPVPKPDDDVPFEIQRTRLGRTARRRAQKRIERKRFGNRVHKGYRRSITKMVASGASLCALLLYLWDRWGGSG